MGEGKEPIINTETRELRMKPQTIDKAGTGDECRDGKDYAT